MSGLSNDARCELCCFGATWFGVGALLSTLLAFDYSEGSQPLLSWTAAGGVAFAVMVVLTVMAVRAARA